MSTTPVTSFIKSTHHKAKSNVANAQSVKGIAFPLAGNPSVANDHIQYIINHHTNKVCDTAKTVTL